MAKRGRPTVFTPEVEAEILQLMALGESEFGAVKRELGLDWAGWWRHKTKQGEEFSNKYTHAKECQLAVWEDKIVATAHDESRDLQPDGKGGFKSDNTAVNRDRLKVDSMKWIMSKLIPDKYGDKIQQEVSGKGGAALTINVNVAEKRG